MKYQKILGLAWTGCVLACGGKVEAPVQVAVEKSPAELAYEAGEQAASAGNWVQAATHFGEAYAANEQMSPALLNQAIAYERGGELQKALTAYKKALDGAPGDAALSLHVARVLTALEKPTEARKVVREALSKAPDEPTLLNTLATLLRMEKKYPKAIETARQVLLRDQKNASAIKTLALVYADQGKLELAETFFRNALKLDENDVDIYVNLGLVAFRRGKHQQAINEFQRALKLDPNKGVAHANIASIALRFRDYARARTSYEQALAAGVRNCRTMAGLGYALEGTMQGEEALTQLEKTYELCPSDKELLFSMGNIAMGQLRDNGRALKYFESYTASKPGLAKDHNVHSLIESLRSMLPDAEAESGSSSGSPMESRESGETQEPSSNAASSGSQAETEFHTAKADLAEIDGGSSKVRACLTAASYPAFTHRSMRWGNEGACRS